MNQAIISDKSTLYIVGYGAIGKALAVFLKKADRNVLIVRGSTDGGSRHRERLQVELVKGGTYEAEVEIATLSSIDHFEGVIVLASKSYGNERLSEILREKAGSSPVVLLQNGLGVERPFLNESYPELYRAVLFVTSQLSGERMVRFRPVADCPIGVERGSADQLESIVHMLHTAEFGFRKEIDIQPVVWKKTIVNCIFNTICPLLEADNGIFNRSADALEMARRVMAECLVLARAMCIPLTMLELEDSLLQISRSSDGQLISTLQDIRNQRRTELDALNFEMVRIAQNLHLENEVSLTRTLGELTAMKAELARQTLT